MKILACSLDVPLVDYLNKGTHAPTIVEKDTALHDGDKYELAYSLKRALLRIRKLPVDNDKSSRVWLVPVQQIRWMTPKLLPKDRSGSSS